MKAIGNSRNEAKEVWVAVPNDDTNISIVTVNGQGGTETTYAPSLIHDEGVVTGHRVCGFEVELLDTCPNDPSGQSCVNAAAAIDPGDVQFEPG